MSNPVDRAELAPRRTLIVANRCANTMLLKAEIRRRARERPTRFSLLVPNIASRRHDDDWTLERATELLARDAGGPVDCLPGVEDPQDAVRQALAEGDFDDVIISTRPRRTSEWLRRDLPHGVRRLGVPVTVVTPPSTPPSFDAATSAYADAFRRVGATHT